MAYENYFLAFFFVKETKQRNEYIQICSSLKEGV